jgi:hypothetical protein
MTRAGAAEPASRVRTASTSTAHVSAQPGRLYSQIQLVVAVGEEGGGHLVGPLGQVPARQRPQDEPVAAFQSGHVTPRPERGV